VALCQSVRLFDLLERARQRGLADCVQEALVVVGEIRDMVLAQEMLALLAWSARREDAINKPSSPFLLETLSWLAVRADGDADARVEHKLEALYLLAEAPVLAPALETMLRGDVFAAQVVAPVNSARKQQKSFAGIAEKVWSLLRRRGAGAGLQGGGAER